MKKLVALLLAGSVMPAWGGIYIYGTRIIYPAQKKEITVQLMNEGSRSSLVQSWIDDGDTSLPPEKIQVPFVITPPVARVGGGSGQQLKIKQLTNSLPKDRESLFFLTSWIFRLTQRSLKVRTSLNSLCRIALNLFIAHKVSLV